MRTLFTCLSALLLLATVSALAQPPELRAPFSQTTPTVDGNIGTSEWQNARSYSLTFTHYLTSTTQSMPVWLLNDGSYLYVAAKAYFATDPYFWYGLYFDGDHSHTLKGSFAEPHVTVNYNTAGTASPAYPFYDEYRIVQAGCASYSVTPPPGADHKFTVSGANELSFEFKVPLSDLTVQPGGTTGFAITLGVNSTSGNNWAYPVKTPCTDLTQWAHLVIETVPSSAAFCEDFDDGTNWTSRWTPFYGNIPAAPTIVTTPTHSGTQALAFQSCWPAIYRNSFEASGGTYIGWVYQTNTAQQGAQYIIQSDYNGSNWLGSRNYQFEFSCNGTPGGGTMVLVRRENDVATVVTSLKPVQFGRNEWTKIFIVRLMPDTIIAGYERIGGFRDSVMYVDPSPLTSAGKFIIMSCGLNQSNAYFWDDICYEPQPPPLTTVAFDIKPGSCPNPFIVKSGGGGNQFDEPSDEATTNAVGKKSPYPKTEPKDVLPTAVLGTAQFDVTTVDVSTVRLKGVAPVRAELEDVGTPQPANALACACNTTGPDGITDLTIKFYRAEVERALGPVQVGDVISLEIVGKLKDGSDFEGHDCMVIVGDPNSVGSPSTGDNPLALANYPNPFNPTTTISFAMPQAGYAKLDIYNTLGQLVATLVEEKLEAGVHAVTWNASGQASGLYLYRLTMSDFIETKKMVLIK